MAVYDFFNRRISCEHDQQPERMSSQHTHFLDAERTTPKKSYNWISILALVNVHK